MYDEPEEPEGFEDPAFPPEHAQKLIEDFSESCRKLGLYVVEASIGTVVDGRINAGAALENPDRFLKVTFSVGDVAFSPRVEDPEQDKFNDEFRRISTADVDDEMDRIREQYGHKKQDEEDS